MDVEKIKKNSVVFWKWFQESLKSFMEWKPVPTSNSMSHRAEVKDDTTTILVQWEVYQRSKYEES